MLFCCYKPDNAINLSTHECRVRSRTPAALDTVSMTKLLQYPPIHLKIHLTSGFRLQGVFLRACRRKNKMRLSTEKSLRFIDKLTACLPFNK